MVKSMTGFGRGSYEENGRSFTVEIRTVNHRYADISIKLPRQLSYLEDEVRKYVLQYISRGKVDIFITQDKFREEDISVSIDDAVTSAYIKALYELRDRYKLEDDITVSVISKLPDILNISKAEEDKEDVWNTLKNAIHISLDELIAMRETEGKKISGDILERGKYVRSIVKKIEARSPVVVQEYKDKLAERIKEIMGDVCVDQTRLAMEVALFADRSSITEEIVRLYSHLDQLQTIISENEPVGRKLDFLVQEINREINTIGSKASDLEITNYIVEAKSEIEKIREQIQNIE
ncbi:MAG: YicC/YloC family endoribonuclease [Clostridiales bacterium]|nr:YicC/YloC family endoribonuclease [Clostridiales bacterium]